MIKKILVQCGRLSPFYNNKIHFAYQGKKGESELTGLFLKTQIEEFKDAKRILIFPESIAMQNWQKLETGDKFLNKIKLLDLQYYLNNTETILSEHPHIMGADLLVVSSLGYFKLNDSPEIEFNSSLDRITLQIFLHLAANFSSEELEEIYLEISSGQNIYIAAMMNATYRFLPFIKFKRFLCQEHGSIAGFILNSDPILPQNSHTINIQKSKFLAKAFNTLTYKNVDTMNKLIKSVFKGKEYFLELKKFIEEDYFFLHGSLIYTCPMASVFADLSSLSKLFDEIGIEQIFRDLEKYYQRNWPETEIDSIDANLVYSLSFALGIGNSIFQSEKSILLSDKELIFNIEHEKKDIHLVNKPLDLIFNLLKKVYGQPGRDYSGDLKKLIKSFMDADKQAPNEFLSYGDLLGILQTNYNVNRNFDSRNYFAHGGFEKNITEIKIEKDLVRVRYNEEVAITSKKKILKYLKK